MKATNVLNQALRHMEDRAQTYDTESGERSMEQTIRLFNVLTGHSVKTEEGWLLMLLLKLVRNQTRPQPHQDSLEDAVAYAALYAEECLKNQQ